ncbi:MAG TPA: PP2C family protein-serine/threonine phosphatase [Dongiaceae bacterium]|nr:PP2C family protein-serine/threonine phosphatase [Dongiaceae bacterium]
MSGSPGPRDEALARSLEERVRDALERRLAGAPGADPDTLARVLGAVTGSQVGHDVIRLAEQLAERMDAERRVDREIAIAREVQTRLFPQETPRLEHLELAARCLQARSVGGDYYDFLALGPDQVGFVIADVSGKGVHAALRMANLQAHLRSQAGSAPRDPLRVLREVNRMLCQSSSAGQFATLFLGVYSDTSRRLSYINCGHNPPLCLRTGGGVERFAATATVLGAFPVWECALGRSLLGPGDLVVAYSDGITEAERDGTHYGEERLLEVLRANADVPPDAILAAVLADVLDFGAGEQSDDLTLLVARAR